MLDQELFSGMLRAYNPNYENEFLSYENQDHYQNNLAKLGTNWEYASKKIYYKYNSIGHRSCELSELTNDYLLFAGCSVTEGVALANEDIYCNLVASRHNKQYYNLGVGGSCPTISAKNMLAFLSLVQKHPYAIIVQWPYFYRYFRVSNGYFINHLTPAGEDLEYYNFMQKERDAYRFNVLERAYFFHYLKNINYRGQVIEMFSQTEDEITEIVETAGVPVESNYFMTPNMIDYARDLGHPGSKTHKLYANKILKLLK